MLRARAVPLSAQVGAIASIFTHLLQARWPQRQKLATILTSRSLRGRIQSFDEAEGNLGFRWVVFATGCF